MKLHIKHLFALPTIVFLLIFVIFPTVYLWYIAFSNATFMNIRNPTFCGLKNFIEVLDPSIGLAKSLLFSFKFATVAVIVQILVGLGLALLFNREFKGKSIFLTLFFLPMLTSSALLGVIGRLLFNAEIGTATYFINVIAQGFGMYILPLDKDWVFPTLIYLDTVNWTPFIFLLLYTDLRSLPKEYIEAASIDGASSISIFRHIILPYLKPLIGILSIIRFADAFKTFDIIYTLTGGGPGDLTTSYSIKVYELAFVKGNFGLAAASSLIGFFILIIPGSIVISYTRRRWAK